MSAGSVVVVAVSGAVVVVFCAATVVVVPTGISAGGSALTNRYVNPISAITMTGRIQRPSLGSSLLTTLRIGGPGATPRELGRGPPLWGLRSPVWNFKGEPESSRVAAYASVERSRSVLQNRVSTFSSTTTDPPGRRRRRRKQPDPSE